MIFSRRKGAFVFSIDGIRQLLIFIILLVIVFYFISAAMGPAIPVAERTAKILDCLRWDWSACAGLLSFW
ncbi:MAG: hypothetical protein ABIF85_06465 [Nanoarchaeota archaeon]|nr:hypothetical protein [Nanoarchaeota archaeon]MBU4300508.1 hypothetical protein [Nanoarchaeota archaeon]MBU4451988.1 hypothetical protein [Nanoarchaeota archaeon]MCG2724148.1 hypothetical protein [archaeon]